MGLADFLPECANERRKIGSPICPLLGSTCHLVNGHYQAQSGHVTEPTDSLLGRRWSSADVYDPKSPLAYL